MGLEKLHRLTSATDYRLQVNLMDFDGRTYQAVYDRFQVLNTFYRRDKENDIDAGRTRQHLCFEDWRLQ